MGVHMTARRYMDQSTSENVTAGRRWWVYTLVALMLAVLVIPSPVAADPGDVHALENENDVSWMEVNSFVNHDYEEVPLREGQYDYVDWLGRKWDGFGVRHIRGGHPEGVPPTWELQETIVNESSCVYSSWESKWRCWNGQSLLFVVYTFNGHYKAPPEDRDEPMGIITAYRMSSPPCYMIKKNSPKCKPPEALDSILHYSGPDSAVNGQPLEVSTYLTDDQGIAARDRDVSFVLGDGDNAQSCTGTTSNSGLATCTIDAVDQPPGSEVPLTMKFAGDKGYKATSETVHLSTKSPTKVEWKGPEYIANGTDQTLTASLKDTFADKPVANQKVSLTLGEGDSQQKCTGRTGNDGVASCVIESVDQPLNDAATVPATANFAGTDAYLASKDNTDVKLEYYTGRAYGVAADINLPVVGTIALPPQPNTGEIRTARATTTDTGCTTEVDTAVITVGSLCPEVATTLNPGKSTATSSIAQATVKLPGIAEIEVSGLTASAESTCRTATGSTTVELAINGEPIPVPDTPGARIDLPGGGEIIVNEQQPDSDADQGITVTGLRISSTLGLADITLAQASSGVHHCAP